MSSREEFEKEWEKLMGHRPTRSIALGGENSYEGRAEAAWWGWQASRAALVIELPEKWGEYTEAGSAACDAIDECRETLESAGITVAQK